MTVLLDNYKNFLNFYTQGLFRIFSALTSELIGILWAYMSLTTVPTDKKRRDHFYNGAMHCFGYRNVSI